MAAVDVSILLFDALSLASNNAAVDGEADVG